MTRHPLKTGVRTAGRPARGAADCVPRRPRPQALSPGCKARAIGGEGTRRGECMAPWRPGWATRPGYRRNESFAPRKPSPCIWGYLPWLLVYYVEFFCESPGEETKRIICFHRHSIEQKKRKKETDSPPSPPLTVPLSLSTFLSSPRPPSLSVTKYRCVCQSSVRRLSAAAGVGGASLRACGPLPCPRRARRARPLSPGVIPRVRCELRQSGDAAGPGRWAGEREVKAKTWGLA